MAKDEKKEGWETWIFKIAMVLGLLAIACKTPGRQARSHNNVDLSWDVSSSPFVSFLVPVHFLKGKAKAVGSSQTFEAWGHCLSAHPLATALALGDSASGNFCSFSLALSSARLLTTRCWFWVMLQDDKCGQLAFIHLDDCFDHCRATANICNLSL